MAWHDRNLVSHVSPTMSNRLDYYFYDILCRTRVGSLRINEIPKHVSGGLRVANLDPLCENLALKKDISPRLSVQVYRGNFMYPLNRSLIFFPTKIKAKTFFHEKLLSICFAFYFKNPCNSISHLQIN